MKTIKLITLVCLTLLATHAVRAGSMMSVPPPTNTARLAAIDKLQIAEIITHEQALDFKTSTYPRVRRENKIEGAKIVELLNSMAKFKGSTSGNYAENLAYLSSSKPKILVTTRTWVNCEKAGNTVPASAVASLLVRLSAFVNPPAS